MSTISRYDGTQSRGNYFSHKNYQFIYFLSLLNPLTQIGTVIHFIDSFYLLSSALFCDKLMPFCNLLLTRIVDIYYELFNNDFCFLQIHVLGEKFWKKCIITVYYCIIFRIVILLLILIPQRCFKNSHVDSQGNMVMSKFCCFLQK